MDDTTMAAWYNRLTDQEREDLCDAYEHDDLLPQKLVDTFPEDGRPHSRGGWATLVHQATVGVNDKTSHYHMTDHLRGFLAGRCGTASRLDRSGGV